MFTGLTIVSRQVQKSGLKGLGRCCKLGFCGLGFWGLGFRATPAGCANMQVAGGLGEGSAGVYPRG